MSHTPRSAPRNVVTVSDIPPELHDWLKEEAARLSEETGKRVAFSRLVVDAIREKKERTERPEELPAVRPKGAEYEYVLYDGRGPFATVQGAMDALKLPKDKRPHHSRWDRLSEELKKLIQRREKKYRMDLEKVLSSWRDILAHSLADLPFIELELVLQTVEFLEELRLGRL